jgi:hypothetical protein
VSLKYESLVYPRILTEEDILGPFEVDERFANMALRVSMAQSPLSLAPSVSSVTASPSPSGSASPLPPRAYPWSVPPLPLCDAGFMLPSAQPVYMFDTFAARYAASPRSLSPRSPMSATSRRGVESKAAVVPSSSPSSSSSSSSTLLRSAPAGVHLIVFQNGLNVRGWAAYRHAARRHIEPPAHRPFVLTVMPDAGVTSLRACGAGVPIRPAGSAVRREAHAPLRDDARRDVEPGGHRACHRAVAALLTLALAP